MTAKTVMGTMSRAVVLALILGVGAALVDAHDASSPPQQLARQILDTCGIRGGLVVHLDCGDGTLTAALGAGEGFLAQGLDRDAADIQKASQHIRSLGLFGKVSVEHWAGGRLPYVDNLVNLIVSEHPMDVPMDEVLRVLAPGGVVYVKESGQWVKTVKPWPEEIDEWTHYLHDADGNAVAHDTVVGPPRHLQWKAGPVFARHHDKLASASAMVSAGGRVFCVIDEGPTSLMHYPPKWRLVARDAFNGLLLWKRPIPSWEDYLRAFRSGPPQLPRRLVAVGGRVYVTLGLEAPVSQLDAATGTILRTYEGTEGADEILYCDGVLLLVVLDVEAPEAAVRKRRGSPAGQGARSLVAVDADTGVVLWRKAGTETASLRPVTLAAGGHSVVFQCGQEVRCADLKTGRPVWRYSPPGSSQPRGDASKKPAKASSGRLPRSRARQPTWSAGYYAPTMVVCEAEGVVLSADLGRLTALSLDDGEPLWSCPCRPDFHAPADVFLADGLVWAGLFAAEGRDPKTGQIKRTLDITGLLTDGHHPRCYRNKATDRFIIADKRGMEFFDLRSDGHSRNNWARGGCQYGILPSGGLTYLPPNACCCYPGAMLHGFYALAPQRREEPQAPEADGGSRLRRGPAYGTVRRTAGGSQRDCWPTFRADETRSGRAATPVPVSLAAAWKTQVGGRLSAPVIAEGKLLVCSIDQRRVVALDAASGKPLWSYAAGGRVDTPPTVYGGLALFRAADGWVYCLRAADGQLVWQFRAAPHQRRVVVDGQLESAWPVHGNVLVKDGTAYLAAGRSCYLDGGIYLYGLEAETGERLYETRVVIPHAEDESLAFIMAGVRPDVLVSDGVYLYLQQLKFDTRLARQADLGRHLLCHSGLADDTWFYRTFWRLGYGDAYDFPNSYIKHDLRVPFGQLLVFDDEVVCGLQTFFSPRIAGDLADKSSRGCMLFGDPNTPFAPDEKTSPESDYPPGKAKRPDTPSDHKWTAKLPLQARAIVLAAGTLFVAGWPDVIDPDDPHAAPEGRKGGRLWVFSAETGRKLAEYELDRPPVFDGLAAAGGRLYLSTTGGEVVCLAGK